MEQVVIIVIIGLISLVNWLMKRSAEIREQRREERSRLGIPEGDPFHHSEPKSDPPAPSSPGPNVEMRRLMEALGIPMEEAEVLVPVVREDPPVLPPLPAFQPPPAPKKSPAENPNRQAFAIPCAATETPLSIALRSRDGVRQAIVLREILGPPKAFTL